MIVTFVKNVKRSLEMLRVVISDEVHLRLSGCVNSNIFDTGCLTVQDSSMNVPLIVNMLPCGVELPISA